MRYGLLCLGLLLSPLTTFAQDASWQQIKNEARGQTVWFNAWGGDNAVNQYLDWVSGEMKTHYAINLKIVRLADAADAVKRIQTEAAAGRKTGGSVDLLWVNGENFRTLKEANLLQTQWAQMLPNWRYVDTQKPVSEDFSIPTEGAESPWAAHSSPLLPGVIPPRNRHNPHRRCWRLPKRILVPCPTRVPLILPARHSWNSY